jgi:hypothetical protein
MSVGMFRAYLVLGLFWIGLGIAELVRGGLGSGLSYLAFGIAWFVIALLRRKGICPDRSRPPPPNPYQENCPANAPRFDRAMPSA